MYYINRMSLECDPEAELQDVMYSSKTIHDDNTLCLICHHNENSEKDQWDRYLLKCGHAYHTRCFRRWCYEKDSVNCPLCGFSQKEEHLYCSACNSFGHCDLFSGCNVIKKRKRTRGRMDKRWLELYTHILNGEIQVH